MQTSPLWRLGDLLCAAILLLYGGAKFAGVQLAPLELGDTKVSELSSLTLLWYFFGYSRVYAVFIAVGQVVAAGLLIVRKTRRFGYIAMFAITSNIALLDWTFGVPLPATLLASALALYAGVSLVREASVLKQLLDSP